MSNKSEKVDVMKVDKDNFIDFITEATPSELNELIAKRGKPCKLYNPFFVFRTQNHKEE